MLECMCPYVKRRRGKATRKKRKKSLRHVALCLKDCVLMLLNVCPYAHILVSTCLITCLLMLAGKENEDDETDDEDMVPIGSSSPTFGMAPRPDLARRAARLKAPPTKKTKEKVICVSLFFNTCVLMFLCVCP